MGTLIPFSPVFAATGAGVIENADFANYRNGKANYRNGKYVLR
jgi:hypothetical protein